MAAEQSAVITLYQKKDRVGGQATVTLPDCPLYHYYDEIKTYGHPHQETLDNLSIRKIKFRKIVFSIRKDERKSGFCIIFGLEL